MCSPTRTFRRGDGGDGVIPPGSTIGILGGGQLGRMTAMAARTLGLPCSRARSGRELRGERRGRSRRRREVRRRRRSGGSRTPMRCRHARDRADRPGRARGRDGACARPPESHDSRHGAGSVAAEALALATTDFPSATTVTSRRSSNSRPHGETLVRSCVKANHGGYDGRSQVRVADAAAVERAWDDLGRSRVGRRTARSIYDRRSPSSSRDGRAARFASIRRRSTFTSDRFSPGLYFPLQ